ncbi:ABC transporter permease [Clostridium sp. Cult1]|nr:ABC transporter permease [Clostridium sp. Cult1]
MGLQPYVYRILLIFILIVMIIVLSFASSYFLTLGNIKNILDQASLYIILSVGMTFVICSGGIDLSIGSVIALSSIVSAFAMKAGLNVGISVFIGLVVAMGVGLFNGYMISYLKINPFIVTLSTMSIIRGATVLITKGRPIYGFPKAFTYLGSGTIGFLNYPILIAFFVTFIGVILLGKTRFGNYSIAMGCNEEALRRSGVNTNKYKIWIYILCGLCAGIAGLIISARLNTAEPLAGTGYEMDAIAAVVLGGTDMRGGRGSVSDTFIACLILGVINNGLRILSISSNYQQLLTGIIILVTVALSDYKQRKRINA